MPSLVLLAIKMKKLIAVLFFTVFIYGSNGKLVGTIVQKSDNSPAVGVNIILVDTYLGAASDEQGKFVVLNIPPGTYSCLLYTSDAADE